MGERAELKLAKWPFLVGDGLMLAVGFLIYWESTRPMSFWQVGWAVCCVAGGACLSITPFLLEYRLVARLAEARGLTTVVEQLRKLESVAAQITDAARQWQSVQRDAGKPDAAAKELPERTDPKNLGLKDSSQRMNDSKKPDVPLEVEKLRRLDHDWLQVLVQVLDHVYALQLGALHSGQPNLVEQLSNFQNACREAARRVGLTPFIAEPGERFDPQRHQRLDEAGPAPERAAVTETIATGYLIQGRLLRPALVRLEKSTGGEVREGQTEEGQSQLGLVVKEPA